MNNGHIWVGEWKKECTSVGGLKGYMKVQQNNDVATTARGAQH